MNLSSEELVYEVREHVAYITINRPERRNALTILLKKNLSYMLCEANENTDVWAVVLTGTGDKAFCSGIDLKEINDQAKKGQRYSAPMTEPDRNHFEIMLETYKPTIAALNGATVGGGCELALACDIRIAAEHAVIGLPEAKRGMGANFGSVLLTRLIPRAVALQMLYTGDFLSAQEALQWGLVNMVVPKEELLTETEKLVRKIVANAPISLQRFKHISVKGWELSVAQALRINVGPNPYLSEDRKREYVLLLKKGRQIGKIAKKNFNRLNIFEAIFHGGR